MKHLNPLTGLLLILCIGLFSFAFQSGGSIKGSIIPASAAKLVWAVSPSDTLKAVITGGSFTINHVKTGTYKIMIDASAPYKDFMKDGVQVTEGQETNIGEIKLQK